MGADYHSWIDGLSETRRSFVVPWPCDDKEFEALVVFEQVLREVPPEACGRLLDYLRDKYANPKGAGHE